MVAEELGIDSAGGGDTTWKRPELARGLEADECYYFLPEKIAADAAALERGSDDIADYPNPDLAIEVDLSPPQVDRAGIYAALRVAEVWRFDGRTVVIDRLTADGTYMAADAASSFQSGLRKSSAGLLTKPRAASRPGRCGCERSSGHERRNRATNEVGELWNGGRSPPSGETG